MLCYFCEEKKEKFYGHKAVIISCSGLKLKEIQANGCILGKLGLYT